MLKMYRQASISAIPCRYCLTYKNHKPGIIDPHGLYIDVTRYDYKKQYRCAYCGSEYTEIVVRGRNRSIGDNKETPEREHRDR